MPLSAGDRFGPYEILAAIGAGGMGEVYRGRDTKLKRDVAVKVLPEAFAHDPGRMARFQREAEVLASLNHPNIAHIYGVEERALVMELVEGESPKGPMPFEDAWTIALQMADALEYAHEKGVIHRDLKPANVKVTQDGIVKLLDFGLAKAFSDAPDSVASDPANSPTVTLGATVAGTIMGTAAYMAPEQARGKKVDKRADIWSWAVVLYELLTGERPFQGEDVAETLAAVIHKAPDYDKTPVEARKLLRACLQKDPKRRLRDIGDSTQLLDREASPNSAPQPSASKLGWIAAVTMAALAALLGLGYYNSKQPTPLRPLVHLEVDLGEDLPNSTVSPNVILSPDGSRVVFVSNGRLFTRKLEEGQPHEMQGTNGAAAPFFSPDGEWVAYFAPNKLKKVAVNGGTPVDIADFVGTPQSGTWGEDGNILADAGADVLRRIPAGGGAPVQIAKFAAGEGAQKWPQLLPGAKTVLFTSNRGRSGFAAAKIAALRLADGTRKTLVEGATFGRYLSASPTAGHLIYISNGTLFAAPFQSERLEITGPAIALVENVAYSDYSGAAQVDISQSGMLVYQTGVGSDGLQTISWIDAAGEVRPLNSKPGFYQQLRLSPDGKRLAYRDGNSGGADIFIRDTLSDREIRIPSAGGYPVFTSDGKYVAFVKGGDGIWWTRADASSEPQLLLPGRANTFSFAPGSKFLAFQRQDGQVAPYHAWVVPIEEGDFGLRAGKPELLVPSGVEERHPTFSPDGKWFAYSSRESGAFEVYVRAFPDRGRKWQVSTNGGVYPEWTQTGDLFYQTLDNHVMVSTHTVQGDSFVPGQPHQWTPLTIGDPSFGFNSALDYAVAPDGKRIAALMLAQVSANQSRRRTVVFLQNFSDELQRRVPLK